MKRLYGAIALLILTGITTTVSAADCRVNSGAWQHVGAGGTLNLQVPVTVRVSADSARLLLEGARLECRFTPGQPFPTFLDLWRTSALAGAPWTPGPKFVSQGTGLRINGTHYNTPVPYELYLASMLNNGIGVPIDVTPYILIRNNPTNPIDIRIGDTLGVLRLRQTNNYNTTSTLLVVTYTAANNFTVSPSTCTINNNNPIEINFGTVNQREIGTDPLTTPIRSNRRLTYSCPAGGITSPITITYKGTPSSFDSRLLRMTNTDVGTALIRAGSAVQVNGRFLTQITNSVGGDDVTFTLVRRAGSLPAAGAISGSGVLVMGVP
ncbi:fimbrial protein [Pseudomonas sp. FP2335]|jgi:type 1 fimbria pilin|uniref:fimbrial protein n=1 Tax=Pseudomonas sp. FP2335 TaxID=2954092 RepID=UPI002732E20B|nr:fimbrial protein [Pseudomonas sp. FP2335]WLH76778.1 fimbrial protein [Pseudomonas sp. FP2335]